MEVLQHWLRIKNVKFAFKRLSHCRNREGLTINIGENGRNGAQARCQKGHKSCSGKMCKITTMKCYFGLCDCLNSVAKNTGFTYLIFSIEEGFIQKRILGPFFYYISKSLPIL